MPPFKVNSILQGTRLRLRSINHWPGVTEGMSGGTVIKQMKKAESVKRCLVKGKSDGGIVTEQFLPVECSLGTIAVLIVTYDSLLFIHATTSVRQVVGYAHFFFLIWSYRTWLPLLCLPFEVDSDLCCKSWKCQLRSRKEYFWRW